MIDPLLSVIETTPDDFSGSDTDRVEAAFNRVRSSGGTGHVVLRRIYNLSRPLSFPEVDGFTMVGTGPASGFAITDPTFPPISYALSSAQGKYGLLRRETIPNGAARVLQGSRSVQVTNPDAFPVGTQIRIGSASTAGDGSVVWGYQHNRVTGRTVSDFLDLELPLPFPCDAGAYIDLFHLREGLCLANFNIYSDAPVEHDGLVLIHEMKAVVENVHGEGMGRFAGTGACGAFLIFSDGFRNTIRSVSADKCGANGEDAMAFRLQSGMKATDLAARNSTFGVGLTYVTDSEMANVSSDNDNGRAMKLWSAKRVAMSNFRVAGARHVAFGLSGWTTDCVLSGYRFSDVNTPGGQNTGIWFNGQSNDNNVITGGLIENCPIAAVSITKTDQRNFVRGVFRSPTSVAQGSTSKIVSE
jgi:hypothetical protein